MLHCQANYSYSNMAELLLGISARRRRRGHICASITKMVMRVCNLEEKDSLSERDELIVTQLAGDLEKLKVQHKELHFGVIDLIDDGDLETEQKEQDDYEGLIGTPYLSI